MINLINIDTKAAEPKKTVLISSSYGLWPILEYELDMAKRKLDDGYRVIFLTCEGDVPSCEANKSDNGKPIKRHCLECKSRVKHGLGWLQTEDNQLSVISHKKLFPEQQEYIDSTLDSLSKYDEAHIRSLVNIGDIDIFESSISALITELQVSKPCFSQHFKKLKLHLRVAMESYYSAVNILEEWSVDEVYIYNGRFPKYRPILRVANKIGLAVKVYEYPYSGFENYITIDGTYPHDFGNTSKLIQLVVTSSPLPEEKIISEGKNWFRERMIDKTQLAEPMLPSFNHWQNTGEMGEWEDNLYNIVFFVSSEHEYYAIKEVKETQPYGQIEALRTILSATRTALVNVRVHPNLQDRDPLFLSQLMDLEDEKRIKIIDASSSIDSYELMSKADLIVSFGSTTGIEAAFLGKPVITIGASLYDAFPATALAYTHNELLELVTDAENNDYSKFPSITQRNVEACKFAYGYCNFGERPKYLVRQSFAGGTMLSSEGRIKIQAKWYIIIFNRLIDLPSRLIKGVMSLSDPYKREKFFANPINLLFTKLSRHE